MVCKINILNDIVFRGSETREVERLYPVKFIVAQWSTSVKEVKGKVAPGVTTREVIK
jgi:hypothetical protein